jgi:hypothetical protein
VRLSSLTLVHSDVGLGPRHTDVRSSVAMCRRVRCTAARRRGDFAEVRSLLAEEIVCHEPGDADYSGDHRGCRGRARPDQKGLRDSPRARSRKRFSSPTSTRQHGRAGGRNGPTLVWKGTRSRCPDSRATRSQKCGSGTTVTTRPPRPRLLVRPALVRVAQPYPTSDGRSPAHSPRGIEDPPTSELRSGTESPFVRLAIRQHDCMSS